MRKLKMQNTGNNTTEIWLDGDIVSDDELDFEKEFFGFANVVSPKMVREAVENTEANIIKLHLNSNGGSVPAGLEISNYLQDLATKKAISIIIESWAASIASVIALSGSDLLMPVNTYLMIHNPTVSGLSGDVREIKKAYDFLDKVTNTMAKFYAKKSTHTPDFNEEVAATKFLELMEAETWLTAPEVERIFTHAKTIDAKDYAMSAKLAPGMCAPIDIKNELMRREIRRNLEDAFK